ncbi:FtsW/RodA/SpoVE family cell cycle protein [Flammeovirgaceae bacterium SG7u.111]|nr:FtsW/RodA/SpoVE family cell cycle protein [Flammeovirgaceae bacterium SG7u.132]WPO33809.1 FtsW/RodA/SpoVE family cell cycle protein [Flammeovirgaceae bacterium SG7u.111]
MSSTIQEHSIYKYFQGDKIIWSIAIGLSLLSILVVYSATGQLAYRSAGGDTEHFLMKHTVLVLLAFGAMYICHKIDYVYYSRISRIALLASVPLLIFSWQYGSNINQASRWIIIPFIDYSFQPSDLAKLALIANVASMLSKRQMSIKEFQRAIVPVLFWCGIICGLIGMTDWSSAALLFATCSLLLFIGRVPLKYLGMLFLIGFVAGYFAFTFGQRGNTVQSRLGMYMEDGDVPFQAEQSFIAVATGGVTGKGLGNSTQRNFLPHPYSDFIFAIIVEEYGLIGAVVIISAFLILLFRGMVIVGKSDRAFGGLLVAGLTFSLVVQAFVHMAVVVGILPITGLPLPLLSMGGTSLLFTGMAVGMIISVSRAELSEEELSKRNVRRKFRNPAPII